MGGFGHVAVVEAVQFVEGDVLVAGTSFQYKRQESFYITSSLSDYFLFTNLNHTAKTILASILRVVAIF